LRTKFPNKDIPVWGISHAGHIPKKAFDGKLPSLRGEYKSFFPRNPVEIKNIAMPTYLIDKTITTNDALRIHIMFLIFFFKLDCRKSATLSTNRTNQP